MVDMTVHLIRVEMLKGEECMRLSIDDVATSAISIQTLVVIPHQPMP